MRAALRWPNNNSPRAGRMLCLMVPRTRVTNYLTIRAFVEATFNFDHYAII